MTTIPPTMRALVAPKPCKPDAFEIRDVPVPELKHPNGVLIHVRAAALAMGDFQLAGGSPILRQKLQYPMKVGCEGSGVVVAVGSEVKELREGDEVHGVYLTRPLFQDMENQGFCCEYALSEERLLLKKAAHISFEEAAGLVSYAITMYQNLKRGLEMAGVTSLEGKTVFIPAALSGLGSIGIQLAKNVFGAEKIISTVSTPKMSLVEKHLPGLVDQLIDYKTQKLSDHVPRGSVDFVFSTQWSGFSDGIPLLNPKTGVLISATSAPTPALMKELLGEEGVPFWFAWILDLAQWWYAWQLRGTHIQYTMVSGNMDIREDMEMVGELVVLGKVQLVSRVVNLSDLDAVKEECHKVQTNKGGFGRLVVRVRE